MTDQAAPSEGRSGDGGAGIEGNGVKALRGASFLRFDDRLLFAFLFFSSLLAAARGVHEGYEKVMCHPDYSNATTVFDYSFKVGQGRGICGDQGEARRWVWLMWCNWRCHPQTSFFAFSTLFSNALNDK